MERTYEIEAKNRWHAAAIVDHILCQGKAFGLGDAYHRGATVILTCVGEPRRKDRFHFLAGLFREDFTQ
ncbi:MAG: hypothetical protein JRJ31_16985 [Deltaproteobacteria bacterium]|nr:hypothetical protein [Deltaproteobacteria bacterium]